jgi:hypothetical protein
VSAAVGWDRLVDRYAIATEAVDVAERRGDAAWPTPSIRCSRV